MARGEGERIVKRTRGLLLLLLLLASAGCARRDWTDLLVLTDVTGTWTGTMRGGIVLPSPLQLTLRQQGAKVVGTSSISGVTATQATVESFRGTVEGTVNGEIFSFAITGRGGGSVRAEMTVDGDGMVGQLTGLVAGPMELRLRRTEPETPPSQTQ